jgi:hypothetical protein
MGRHQLLQHADQAPHRVRHGRLVERELAVAVDDPVDEQWSRMRLVSTRAPPDRWIFRFSVRPAIPPERANANGPFSRAAEACPQQAKVVQATSGMRKTLRTPIWGSLA